MNRITTVVFSLAFLALATSCQSKMEKLEDYVYSEDFVYNEKGVQKASELLEIYIEKADSEPNSEQAPDFLFKAAELAMNLEKTQRAMNLYNKVIYSYPQYEKAPECLFLLAFIYENTLQNYGKAKELYELFLEKYPDHDFADDAQFSLQYLGKSPEELMREFESNNADTLDTLAL
jgi:tetratricopeptide (TPR) repeat protein